MIETRADTPADIVETDATFFLKYLCDQEFPAETLKNINTAYSEACKMLAFSDRKLMELVARRIIKLAQQGVESKDALCLLTVHEFSAIPE